MNRVAIKIAWWEWKNLFYSSKLFVIAIMLIFIKVQIVNPLIQCSELMGMKLSYFEPFVAIVNSGAVLLVVPLFYMAIMADFPKEKGISSFLHIRVTSASWIIGELLFIFLSSLTFVLIIGVAGALMLGGYGEFRLEFSDAILKYGSTFPDYRYDYVTTLLPESLYNQMTLSQSLSRSLILVTMYFIILGLVILLASVLNRKFVGIIIDSLILFGGAICCSCRYAVMWLFPMSHTVVWLHYSNFFSEEKVKLSYSYYYFVALIVILTILCIVNRKKYQHNMVFGGQL